MLQKKYVFVKEKMKFTDSLAHCKSLGGILAVAESAEENQWMQQELGECWKTFFCSFVFIVTAEL